VRGNENDYETLVGKPAGKTSLDIPRLRWDDNIKIDVIEIGF
jgi:hypothetical protein